MNRRSLIAATIAAPIAWLAAPWYAGASEVLVNLDTPFVITPQRVVDAMLELAGVGPDDRLLDLGSGDGRIVITAAQRWGTRGLGVEIDPRLVGLAQSLARDAGVADKARFVVQDLFDTDLAQATVITMYLLPDVNMKLRPRLRKLKPGTRIVSHDWDMGDWEPDRTLVVDAPDKPVGIEKKSRLMLWVVR
jgi:SAM-dependent methyltransferase